MTFAIEKQAFAAKSPASSRPRMLYRSLFHAKITTWTDRVAASDTNPNATVAHATMLLDCFWAKIRNKKVWKEK